MAKRKINFGDAFVIYHSIEDGCWVAHSLRTDQIGTGDGIVNALADGLKAVQQVYEAAKQDKSLAFLREAPANIQRLAERAKPLPRELFEIAHLRAHGEWPKEIEGDFTTKDDGKPLRIEVSRDAIMS